MIFVAAGTKDGRELAGFLLHQGYQVTASVVSQYGESLLQAYEGMEINCESLDAAGFEAYFCRQGIELFVDASHPYAADVSQNAMQACSRAGIPYIRYERQQTPLEYDHAFYVQDYRQAAVKAAELGDRIFLTTGSRNLGVFAQAPELQGKKLVCRILPEPEVVGQARALGFAPAEIVALQGPFSLELNRELYKKYGAQVIVTKNSGHTGGTDTKFAAAMELGLSLVVIERPKLGYVRQADSFQQVLDFVKRELG
ncbi:MAG: precorrin-6A reductase [Anaerovibrio sp.]|nr:precorrin-6A reductase [Anaerovibrio sp.]